MSPNSADPADSAASAGSKGRPAPATEPGGREPAGSRNAPPLTTRTLVYRLCAFLSWLASRVVFRLKIRGLENLPAGGCLLVANHQSFLDIPFLGGSIPRHVSFVARDSLANARWLAYVMRECGAVLVKRGAGDRRALRAILAHLEAGDCVAIFPEGTRTRDGRIQPFQSGALHAARRAGVPVVPVGIRGSFEAWPRQQKLPRPHKVELTVGAPLDVREDSGPEAVEALRTTVADLAGVELQPTP